MSEKFFAEAEAAEYGNRSKDCGKVDTTGYRIETAQIYTYST